MEDIMNKSIQTKIIAMLYSAKDKGELPKDQTELMSQLLHIDNLLEAVQSLDIPGYDLLDLSVETLIYSFESMDESASVFMAESFFKKFIQNFKKDKKEQNMVIEKIQDMITEIEKDDRFKAEPAAVQVNAPLALIQVELSTKRTVLKSVLKMLKEEKE